MKKLCCFLFIASLIFGMINFSYAEMSDKDDEYRSKIVGLWHIVPESDAEFEKRTKIFKEKGLKVKKTYIEREFKDDGVFLRKVYDSADKNTCTSIIEGKWWVESGKLYRLPNKFNGKELFFRKKPYVEKIIDVSDDEMTLKDERGDLYKSKKIER